MARPFKRLHDIFWLAFRDYGHEWIMSGCFVLALAAVLAPMLVLFGLKVGIVGSMVERLVEDPRNREIRPVGSGRYDAQWFAELRARPDVAFVIPLTRSIAATIQLKSENAPRIVPVELIPTGAGEPLFADGAPVPEGLQGIVLSDAAARKLRVAPGDRVDGSLARRFQGRSERVHVQLKVDGIAPPAAFARDGVFTSLDLLVAAEDFRDGRAVPVLGWDGESRPEGEARSFAGFRLYARSIHDVEPIRQALTEQGLEVRTRAADIETVKAMERNLSAIFWIVAVIGLIGFSFSLGASLWANVERKRRELSVLRLVGFRTQDIVWFPVFQALFTALLGWGLASLIYFGVENSINQLLAVQLEPGQQICSLQAEHYLIAVAFTAGAAVVAAVLGGLRAARIEPSDGLREI